MALILIWILCKELHLALIPNWCLCNSIFPQDVSEWYYQMAAVIKAATFCIKRWSVIKADLWRMACLLFTVVVRFHSGMYRLSRSVWLWIVKQCGYLQLGKHPTQQQSLTLRKTRIFKTADVSTWNICNLLSETELNKPVEYSYLETALFAIFSILFPRC